MTEDKGKYLVSVVPLIKIPLSREQFFYYLSEKKIQPGSLVEISFGKKRKIKGIALESKNDFVRKGGYQLKKVGTIIAEEFLTKNQLKLAEFVSQYYFSSLGIIMKFFAPAIVKERAKKQKIFTNKERLTEKIKLTANQQSAFEKITSDAQHPTPYLLFGRSSAGKTEILLQSARHIISEEKNSQCLFLVPELTHIPSLFERMLQYFKEDEIAVLHSKLSKGNFFSMWKKIQSGDARIIIGTRQSVFAPFYKLRLIAIDEEHDTSYKQWDMGPRYDARVAAEHLAEIFKARLVFSSASPRIQDYWKGEKKQYNLLNIDRFSPQIPRIEILDMKIERWKKNRSPISRKLKAEIEWTLKNNMQVILFINHQGMSAFSVCKKCREVLKCPKCQRSLVYQKKGNYICLHCDYKTSDFPSCPSCKEMVFENIGVGTEKILRELRKNFYSAKIEIADSQSMQKSRAFEKLWQAFSSHKIDILIGTQMITKGWDLKNVGLVGIIDADSLLSFPDLYTNENAFAHILQAAGRTGRPGGKFPGQVLIQTFQEQNLVIKSAAEENFEMFYAKELSERKELNYPPFGKIIKLVFQDENKKKTETEAEKTFQTFEWIADDLAGVRIYPPKDSMLHNIRGRYRRQIIIKYTCKNLPRKIEQIIKSLGPGWFVDRDPISIT